MADLTSILPDFASKSHGSLLSTLERHGITTAELVSLDPTEICRRTRLPLLDTRRLCVDVGKALRADLVARCRTSRSAPARPPRVISTLDPALDRALGGGVPLGYVTELTGESGAGKTQLLLTLALAVQLPPPRGLGRGAVYVSTEGRLATDRLAQLLARHPGLAAGGASLDRVTTTEALDLEAQDHILRFQAPVELRRRGAALLVLDSVAANYRAEYELAPASRAARTTHLLRLGAHLRDLARDLDVAVVVTNQVSDRIAPDYDPVSKSLLLLDHQQRWFSGWGDHPDPSLVAAAVVSAKNPSLGLVWSSQVACRVALLKQAAAHVTTTNDDRWQRWLKVVFAPHTAPSGPGLQGTVEFEITPAGLRSINTESTATVGGKVEEKGE